MNPTDKVILKAIFRRCQDLHSHERVSEALSVTARELDLSRDRVISTWVNFYTRKLHGQRDSIAGR
jgi:hypothetical protein